MKTNIYHTKWIELNSSVTLDLKNVSSVAHKDDWAFSTNYYSKISNSRTNWDTLYGFDICIVGYNQNIWK